MIGIAQILAAILAVTREIPVLAPVDALPLLPAEDCLIFDVEGLFGVMSQFIGTMLAEVQTVLVVNEPHVPLEAFLLPVVKPLQHLTGVDEELQIPLLKLALAEQEVTWSDLVTESLTNLADTKWNLHTGGLDHIVKVEVDVLAGFTAQVGLHTFTFNNAEVCLHQEVKRTRLHQLAAAFRALVLNDILFR